jgi:hypothetical protein
MRIYSPPFSFFLLAVALGSKTYMLRSCLHPLIIERAALTDEQILEQELADTPFDDSDDEDDNGADDDERRPRPYGSLISWSTTDQLGPLGILYVILALILVSGRVMTDGTSIVSFTPTKVNNSPKQSISVPN